ncbi:isoprenylcysteine carboxylmethyltransferase family protein [Sphingomonas sp. MA1305]|uniref:methyltransferase family protein n=1 Tax=Sphingomonas sp. MA1305 TaxID=2479204 RepID=UPI0018DFEFEA|nr:isoprenylcysteine carboxylmethyltransferase family protein [Sphingomonas sp. MA1305]MBI0474462.1 isoprenylcysteine carboxylmethyltransferase family protein [Sphingomonas sp. MA1305]
MSGVTGLPGLAVTATGLCLFAAAVALARRGRTPEEGARRDRASLLGIGIQGLGFVIVATGPIRVALDPLAASAIGKAILTAVCLGAALALFLWARQTMGRNWSIVARTRMDHALVTAGPFAHVRHPIYTAIGLLLVGVALGLGHEPRLVAALPVYALGTWLRVRIEERLLRMQFGRTYDAYAARVNRFVPLVF